MQSSNPSEPVCGIPVGSTNQNQFYAPNAPTQPTQEMPWSTGLYDCFDDVSNCCLTCWCPCIPFGQIAEIVDKGSTPRGISGGLYALLAMIGITCCYSGVYRSKMRKQYMLQESPCADFLVHCFCEQCALCQEYRELKNRGFDMSIGWNLNVEKQNRGVTMAPAVQGGMSR